MGRILSVDYGRKRTGLAVTDPLQIIAGALSTIETKDLFDFLSAYVVREGVERIVIGKPTQPDGSASENLARVENFVNRWRKARPEVPIEYYDETRRENKGLVDEISATIILQDYMNSKK